MSHDFYTDIDLKSNEIKGALLESVTDSDTPTARRVAYHTVQKAVVTGDGTRWIPAGEAMEGNQELDDLGNGTMYVGYAPAGTAFATPAWKIKRVVEAVDGDISIKWSNGSATAFNVAWTDRASLNYS